MKLVLFFAIAGFLGGVFFGIFTLQHEYTGYQQYGLRLKLPNETMGEYLLTQAKACMAEKQRSLCIRALSDMLVRKHKIPDVLSAVLEQEHEPVVFATCHELGHYIGASLYKKSKNTVDAFHQCGHVCNGGCTHGVVEGYMKEKKIDPINLKSDKLMRDIIGMCGNTTDFSIPRLYDECLHGMGHGLMFLTNGDLPKSLTVCDGLIEKKRRETCYSGIFMENANSTTNRDHPSQFIRSDNPLYPCSILDDKYLHTCYEFQGEYFGKVADHDWKKVVGMCQLAPSRYQEDCVRSIGFSIVGLTHDFPIMKETCDFMPNPYFKNNCIAGVVSVLGGRYILNTSYMLEFCLLVDEVNKQTCYSQMGLSLEGGSHDGSLKERICNQISEPQYASWCREPQINWIRS